MADEEKQLATKAKTAVGGIANFSADAGAGMEGADKDSFAIPFLRVLQPTSPQINEADGQYVEGAKGGMLFNTTTREVYDGKEGVVILPCAFQRRFIQWGPRGSDRGYLGEYLPEEIDALQEQGLVVRDEEDRKLYRLSEVGEKPHEKKTDRVVDTRSHFCIVLDKKGRFLGRMLLALTSTQIKKSKQMMTMVDNARIDVDGVPTKPPTWMNRIIMTTVPESNDDGNWFGVQFAADGFIDTQELYDSGKAFHASIKDGKAKADHSKGEGEAGPGGGSGTSF